MKNMKVQRDSRAIRVDVPKELVNLRIILVEPKDAGNIGASARAMKGMGLTHLTLVNPPSKWGESDEAWRMGRSSREILETCHEVKTLSEAAQGLNYLVGTTHRRRTDKLPEPVTARQAAIQIVSLLKDNVVGIAFGREDKGLTTDELSLCQLSASVPMAGRNPSLNLAQAVMIFAYEIFMASLSEAEVSTSSLELAEVNEVELLCQRVIKILKDIGFKPYNDDWESTIYIIRRMFRQREMEKRDLSAFHRIFSDIERYVSTKGEW